jgi:hypothetical protein
MTAMIDALEWRYATKKFDDSKRIDPSKVEMLKKAFNLTPTSYGLQPLRLLVIKEQELKDKLFEHSYNQIQVKSASHILVICIENSVDEPLSIIILNCRKKSEMQKMRPSDLFENF